VLAQVARERPSAVEQPVDKAEDEHVSQPDRGQCALGRDPLDVGRQVWVHRAPVTRLGGSLEDTSEAIWGTPPEHLDLEFQAGEWVDLGEGRTCLDVLQIYRVKGSGDFAYQRELRVEITIREGKIGRYEIRTIR
jgi:hypothetical protein